MYLFILHWSPVPSYRHIPACTRTNTYARVCAHAHTHPFLSYLYLSCYFAVAICPQLLLWPRLRPRPHPYLIPSPTPLLPLYLSYVLLLCIVFFQPLATVLSHRGLVTGGWSSVAGYSNYLVKSETHIFVYIYTYPGETVVIPNDYWSTLGIMKWFAASSHYLVKWSFGTQKMKHRHGFCRHCFYNRYLEIFINLLLTWLTILRLWQNGHYVADSSFNTISVFF